MRVEGRNQRGVVLRVRQDTEEGGQARAGGLLRPYGRLPLGRVMQRGARRLARQLEKVDREIFGSWQTSAMVSFSFGPEHPSGQPAHGQFA
jgi:hypothetical protein